MSDPVSPSRETLEQVVADILRSAPTAWAEYGPAAHSQLHEQAVSLLTAAGMIERRIAFRLRMAGHRVAVEATITATGEYGLAEAMQFLSKEVWSHWKEHFEQTRANDPEDVPLFHVERMGKEQWRLTPDGMTARNDLDNGGSSMVFDFVLRRGFFDGRPRLLPDGRISRRDWVRGQGGLEKIQLVHTNTAPTAMNIANWEAGAAAFAAAFAELVKANTAPPAETQQGEGGAPLADPFSDLRQFARDKLKGQERAVIEALCDAGGELPLADLAIQPGVGWDDAFQEFKGLQRQLNPTLKAIRWEVRRRHKSAILKALKRR